MSLRKQATSGIIWTFSQQFGNQFIAFVISIVLARLLLPEEFGLIGMVAVFMAIGKSLMDVGLTQSLIRDDETDQEDLSTVFFFNLGASVLIYFLIFALAPLVSAFYDEPQLTKIIRVLCITFVISAFGAIQNTRFTKLMNFKTQTLISVPSTVLSGVVGVGMAYKGFGVWSLVYSRVAFSIAGTTQLWLYSKWTPTLKFNILKFKKHFSYGYKLTLAGLLNTIFSNIYVIIIGKYFSASQVGFYTKSQSLQNLPVTNISSALNKVTFPMFAKIQKDNIRLKRVYKQLMQTVIYIIAPLLIFAIVLAEPTIRFLLTEKWLPAVPYFQILCIVGILHPIHSYNLNVLKVKGRSDLFLKLAIVKKTLIVLGILIGIQFGIYGLLYSQVILSFISFYINAHYTNRFIGYSPLEQLKDILPIILVSITVGGIIWYIDSNITDQNDLIRILVGSFSGLLIYGSIGFLFKVNGFMELLQVIKKFKLR